MVYSCKHPKASQRKITWNIEYNNQAYLVSSTTYMRDPFTRPPMQHLWFVYVDINIIYDRAQVDITAAL